MLTDFWKNVFQQLNIPVEKQNKFLDDINHITLINIIDILLENFTEKQKKDFISLLKNNEKRLSNEDIKNWLVANNLDKNEELTNKIYLTILKTNRDYYRALTQGAN